MCFTLAREVFCISLKMGFVEMVVFLIQGTHLQRQQVADWLFPKREHDREMAQTETKTSVGNISFTWAGYIFSSIIC